MRLTNFFRDFFCFCRDNDTKRLSRAEIEQMGRQGVIEQPPLIAESNTSLCCILNSFYLFSPEEDNSLTPCLKQYGFWEAWITKWILDNVKPGSYCIDVGANIGYFSLLLIDRGCFVQIVEPQPRCVEVINMSLQHNAVKKEAWLGRSSAIVSQVAVGNTVGVTNLWIPKGFLGGGTAVVQGKDRDCDRIQVELTTLDALSEGKHVDFIKIDAEGYEEYIWLGMQELLEKNKSTLVLMEWQSKRYKQPTKFAEELLHKMDISVVEYDGNESKIISIDQLVSLYEEERMIVLRNKLHNNVKC